MQTVVRTITRLNIGGPAIQALSLTKALADDYPTTLVAGRGPADEGELNDANVAVTRIPLVRAVDPVHDVVALRALRRIVRELKPAILHSHMAKAGAIARLSADAARPRPRVVHTFHGHVLEGYFRPSIQELFLRAERFLAARTDALVAVSEEVRDDLLQLGIGRPEQWHVIPLGFHLEPFIAVDQPKGALRESLQIEDFTPLVGALGRFAPVKDHLLLLEAIARLDGVHLVLMGDGECRALLEERAGRRDLRGRVHFAGWRSDVPDVLSDLDAVAVSSVNEGTPVSLIEALSAGRAVVATRVGGVPSVVDHDETGLLVDTRAPADFADALARVLDDKHLRERFRLEGRRRMIERFTFERLVTDIRRLYGGLTNG